VSELDWAGLAFNGMWVLGAAVILAAFSSASYEARCRGERLQARLAAPGFQLWLSVGMALISLGATLLGRRWWERALWGTLCAASAWQLHTAWRARSMEGD
jgi:multisubunit Na+/H+ antiporter MnhB subunit